MSPSYLFAKRFIFQTDQHPFARRFQSAGLPDPQRSMLQGAGHPQVLQVTLPGLAAFYEKVEETL